MDVIIWVLAYTTKDDRALTGFLKDPDFLFTSQEAAHQKKHEAFELLYIKGLVKEIEQLMVVPLNELDVEIE